eukprot:3731934-Alexandrium_andersonii.AAC.1
MMAPDHYLDQTEERDIQLLSNDEHWKLAIRMLHRISKRQYRIGINVDDARWVLAGMEMPVEFFNDLSSLTVDPWEIRGARDHDLTKNFRCPTDADATWLGKKVKGNVEDLQEKEKNALDA